ncbi:peptide chain release factor N(5)-glutamine methyltransferase [Flammeovirgaceae bacterium SG7u.111]|nr:peptide chain release factor N(5)-glutamine methyltransferase [Flammeovirgaceae bacterium SG7u.132]WPO36875.1 peptide chain release factor N(5)-glutamine methyltransferase [Flammeovirgaceae bacterium SG7u.111]
MEKVALEVMREFMEILTSKYEENEAQAIAFELLDKIWGLDKVQVLAKNTIANYDEEQAEDILERLMWNEPVQYITGVAEFYGRQFNVNSETLIPRPETEELVDWIKKDHEGQEGLEIIDIGTGSGCIGLSLALEMAKAKVSLLDVSEGAILVAKSNAEKFGAEVDIIEKSIFDFDLPADKKLDIVVSNPPYVRPWEEVMMKENVLEYEPRDAIFIEEEAPLIFYIDIAEKGAKWLKKGGRIYFEINEAFGPETIELFEKLGYSNCELRKDFVGKDRMAAATWEG